MFSISSTCNSRDVNTLVSDAIALATAGESAAKTLLDSSAFSFISRSIKLSNLIRAASTAWGIKPPGIFGLAAEDRTQLKRVQDNYATLRDTLQNSKIDPSQNFFHCDSSVLEWATKIGDIWAAPVSDEIGSITIEDWYKNNHQGMSVKGVWKDPEHTKGKTFNFVGDAHNGDSNNMFLCPQAWDPTRFKPTLSGLEAKGEVYFKDYSTTAGVFLHEMMHLIFKEPAIIDELIEVGTSRVRAYGMIKCFILGTDKKAQTVTNADSYMVFSTMAYFPEALWLGDAPDA
ncbi:MAG: hypothetical protein M1832_000656 [Thelocarpon impressellum]|nr:MAG: hypothetical protein M1832_000656 [Thelocarpon impressellum]